MKITLDLSYFEIAGLSVPVVQLPKGLTEKEIKWFTDWITAWAATQDRKIEVTDG